ncbi:hypothetical protein [Metabacillus idriensis]|uniref:hypothetical protein n=1 Tax=Metabacillus idriensis TaxID=324768 RepID=UPI00163B0EDD|nr:hypothetical protein [Metabacillus idriensis]QNG60159.1 hypothetical protein H4O14_01115 [Bacillus sp. PAMC26568]
MAGICLSPENEALAKVYYYEKRKENLSLLEDIYAELGLTLNYSGKSLIELEVFLKNIT